MHLCVVRIGEWLLKDISTLLVIGDIVSQSGENYLIVSFNLLMRLRLTCGSRQMFEC